MACRQWNPCSPCTTLVPYPCPAPCPCPSSCCPTGCTGSTGPSLWLQAAFSATNGTVAIQTVPPFLVSGPWAVSGGNSGTSFNPNNGTFTVPTGFDGVYEITFAGSVYNPGAAAITTAVTLSLFIGSTEKVRQAQSGSIVAGGNQPVSLTGIFSLKAGDAVSFLVTSTLPGLYWTSTVYPAASPTFLNIKSLF